MISKSNLIDGVKEMTKHWSIEVLINFICNTVQSFAWSIAARNSAHEESRFNSMDRVVGRVTNMP